MTSIPPAPRSSPPSRAIRPLSMFLLPSLFVSVMITDSIGSECIDYRNALHWDGFLATTSRLTDMVIVGDYAYAAHGTYGLTIFDISDPGFPAIAGSIDLPWNATGIDVAGSYAFITNGELVVVDISDPSDPVPVLFYDDLPATTIEIIIDGDYAYISEESFCLRVVDISDPLTPFLTGWVYAPGDASGIALVDHYVYYARGSVLYIIDVSVPTSPFIVNEIDTPGSALDVDVEGTRAYVADWNAGLLIYDVSDPASPVYLWGDPTEGLATRVAAFGPRVYVSDDAPRQLWIYDATTPTGPTVLGSVRCIGVPRGMHEIDSRLFYLDSIQGLGILNISNPENTQSIGRVTLDDWAFTTVVRDGIGYVANDGVGLTILDVGDPSSPFPLGNVDTPGAAVDVVLKEDFAFIADSNRGLRVADVSDPSNPFLVAGANLQGSARFLVLDDPYLYVMDSGHGIKTFDVSDPAVPVRVGGASVPNCQEIGLEDGFLYVTARTDGLIILDLQADPVNPVTAAQFDLPGYEIQLAVEDTRAYVLCVAADEDEALNVVSISNPYLPWTIRTYQGPIWDAWEITVHERIVYLGDANLGLLVFDTTDDGTDTPVGFGPQGNAVRRPSVTGGFLYAGEFGNQLDVLSLHCSPLSDAVLFNPGTPRFLGPPHPNPTNGRISLVLSLPGRGGISLVLYDAAGRRIRSLLEGTLGPGRHQVDWNGRDRRGHTVPSGAYLVRLSGWNFQEERRVLILR